MCKILSIIMQKSKASTQPSLLIISKSNYNRFENYITENEELAEQLKLKQEKLIAYKKATIEAAKSWNVTSQNTRGNRKQKSSSLMKEEEENEKILKDLLHRRVKEDKIIVDRAKRLLFYQKPECRKINSGLIASECLRELNAQIELKRMIGGISKMEDIEYAKLLKADTDAFLNECQKKNEKQQLKQQKYEQELKQQIMENENLRKIEEKQNEKFEREDREKLIKQIEMDEKEKLVKEKRKKNEFRQNLIKEIENKINLQKKERHEEEYKEKVMWAYSKAKNRIKKINKEIEQKEKTMKENRAKIIAEEYSRLMDELQKRNIDNTEEIAKIKLANELEKHEAAKKYRDTMKTELEKFRLEAVDLKEKNLQEERKLKAIDIEKRFKLDEFNKTVSLKDRKYAIEQKEKYADELAQLLIEKNRLKTMNKEVIDFQTSIQKENEKILDYGNQVLKESAGVRPLFPILKAVKECKKEMGMISPIQVNNTLFTHDQITNSQFCKNK